MPEKFKCQKNSFTQTDRTHNLCSTGLLLQSNAPRSFWMWISLLFSCFLLSHTQLTDARALEQKNQFELGSILFNLRWFNAFFSSFIYIYIYSIQWARVHVVVFSSFAILSFKFFLSLVVILSAVLYFPHFVSESWMAEEWHSFVNLFLQCSSLNSVIRRPSNIYDITHEISHYFASHFAIIGAPLCTVPSERK